MRRPCGSGRRACPFRTSCIKLTLHWHKTSGRPERESVYLTVHRFEDSVYYRRIERETFLLLGALRTGASVAEAVAKTFEKSRQTPEDQGELLRKSFDHASELDWLCPRRNIMMSHRHM